MALLAQASRTLLGNRHSLHARYLCKGDQDDKRQHCIGFSGAKASLKAIEELSSWDAAQRATGEQA